MTKISQKRVNTIYCEVRRFLANLAEKHNLSLDDIKASLTHDGDMVEITGDLASPALQEVVPMKDLQRQHIVESSLERDIDDSFIHKGEIHTIRGFKPRRNSSSPVVCCKANGQVVRLPIDTVNKAKEIDFSGDFEKSL